MNRRRVIAGIVLGVTLVAGAGFYVFRGQREYPYVTALQYPDATFDRLSRRSSLSFTYEDILRMDREVFRIVSRAELSETGAVELYAHIALTQSEFAALSYGRTGTNAGSIVPLTRQVTCTVLPDTCSAMRRTLADADAFTEAYTTTLTDVVHSAYVQHEAMLQQRGMYTHVMVHDVPTMQKGDRMKDIQSLQIALAARTDDELRSGIFWEGTTGTKRSAGIWVSIFDEYLTPLASTMPLHEVLALRTRAFLAAYDAYMTSLEHGGTALGYADTQSTSVLPRESDDVAPPPEVAFIAALSDILVPYLSGEVREDFIAERDEAVHSRLWLGRYTETDIKNAEEIGHFFSQKYIP